MSRPYININALTYSNSVLSMDYAYYKLRGGGTMSITGFSNSISFSETDNYSNNETWTFSVPTLGTSSTTQYPSNSSFAIVFSGTPSAVTTKSTIAIQIAGVNVINTFTASGVTLSNFISGAAAVASFSGAAAGFGVTSTSNGTYSTLTFTAPTNTGNYYNGLTAAVTVVKGTAGSTLTYSVGNTFSGGVNLYNVTLSYPKLGGVDTYTYSI